VDAHQSLSWGAGTAARVLLRSVDAHQSGSCGAWTPTRAAPAELGRPPELHLRGVDAQRSHSGGFWPRYKGGCSREKFTWVYKFMDGKGPLSVEHVTLKFDLYSIVVHYT
jgi:hypothetical protein